MFDEDGIWLKPVANPMCDPEEEALQQAMKIGRKWGYGNVIKRLKTVWALGLVKQGISRPVAAETVGMTKTETEMFLNSGRNR